MRVRGGSVFVWEGGPDEESGARFFVSLVIRWLINAAALWLASEWVRGIDIEGWGSVLATAAIFGLVNAFVKPIAQFIGLPITCLTLGLFILIINTAMLGLTAWIAGLFDLDVNVDGFWAAFLGALLISFVSALLSAFVGRPVKRLLT